MYYSPTNMNQFILFGDSITQQSFSTENYFGSALNNAYVRKLDVVNRGLSGYNTIQALKVLPLFFPTPERARVRFLMVFFGANDARLPGTSGGPQQHVPLAKYKQNLKAIVTHPLVQAHQGIRIMLVTPPSIDERKCIQSDLEKYGELTIRRSACQTMHYAQRVRDVGVELGIPVLDIWTTMARLAGLPEGRHLDSVQYQNCIPGEQRARESEVLNQFLHDGLHFSPPAYVILYEALMKLIRRTWPDQSPEALPFALPAWDDEKTWKDFNAFGDELKL